MRLIGYLPEEGTAKIFADYLYVQGIENHLDHEKEGWGIWVSEEDKLESAAGLLAEFRQNPTDPKYKTGSKADDLRAKEEKGDEEYRKKLKSRRHLFKPLHPYGFGALTFVLIVICVIVFILSGWGYQNEKIMGLFILDFSGYVIDRSLPEIRRGEIWRLITPVFIHFGPLHILFNMLWLRDLGSMIEARQNALVLGILVLVIAACSNVLQFYVEGSPAFGGMSGVVYGLLGYIWLRGKFDPGSGLFLHSSTVTMMIIWFFICLSGLLPFNVANTAHGVGLVMGMAWGYLSSLRHH